MWKTHAAFTFGGAGPSRCISSSVLDSPNSSCLNAQNQEDSNKRGYLCFSSWTTCPRAGSLGFHSQRKREPMGKEMCGALLAKAAREA